eukprot:TRINITY_DN92_c3_g1_i1.p1 TRINITY_DN92_c3_g1~~TRINITY_DN92_c3_g1_i1.p1  ORF type:complete len:573 (+),score=50.57 TRINITY_DN92_c3_g1_i1:197-1915(+)
MPSQQSHDEFNKYSCSVDLMDPFNAARIKRTKDGLSCMGDVVRTGDNDLASEVRYLVLYDDGSKEYVTNTNFRGEIIKSSCQPMLGFESNRRSPWPARSLPQLERFTCLPLGVQNDLLSFVGERASDDVRAVQQDLLSLRCASRNSLLFAMSSDVWSVLCLSADATALSVTRKAHLFGDQARELTLDSGCDNPSDNGVPLDIVVHVCKHIEVANVSVDTEELSVHGSRYSDTLLGTLSRFARLKVLHFTPCDQIQLVGRSLPQFAQSQLLEELHINDCIFLTDEYVAPLAACGRLRVVDFAGCFRLGDASLKAIANCPLLQHVDFSDCKAITNLDPLRQCTNLKSIEFDNCECLNSAVAIRACQHLEVARLSHCWRLSNDSVCALAECPLSEVNLWSSGVTSLTPFAQCSGLKCAKFMFLDVDEASFLALGKCPLLEELRFAYCKRVGDCGVSALATCALMKRITLMGMPLLTDSGVSSLANCSSLEEVNLVECKKLTDRSLEALSACERIRIVSVAGCKLLSHETILVLSRWPSLQRACLNRCPKINKQFAKQMLQHLHATQVGKYPGNFV